MRVASYTNQRAMDRIKSGQLPGPELSIAKLALTQNMWRMAQFMGRGAAAGLEGEGAAPGAPDSSMGTVTVIGAPPCTSMVVFHVFFDGALASMT